MKLLKLQTYDVLDIAHEKWSTKQRQPFCRKKLKDVNLIFIDPVAKNTDKFNKQPSELSSF